jgi:hypothetical protein
MTTARAITTHVAIFTLVSLFFAAVGALQASAPCIDAYSRADRDANWYPNAQVIQSAADHYAQTQTGHDRYH